MLAAVVLLVPLGWWTYSAVERSLGELRAATLEAMLEAEARALAIWVRNRQSDVRRVARDPEVRKHVEALVTIASRPGAAARQYCAAPARRPLVDSLAAVLEEQGAASFNAVDRSRHIIAARFPEYCGLRIATAAFERQFAPVFDGETHFVPPHREAERLETLPPKPALERPLTWIEAPVRNAAGEVIAALGFGEYADGQFAAILSAARIAETGEAYAFDRAGALLSPGRFAAEPAVSPHGARLDEAERGMLLEPYASYHGGKVIGAWRWLPEYDIGIAVEMSAAEAYAPLAYLKIAFGVVFGALVLSVLAALGGGLSLLRLRREIGGRRIGAYRVQERIGEGGTAVVYRAQHDLLKRPTALKVLRLAKTSDEILARFEREVQLASSLSHPNTVEIFDYGRTREGQPYFAMEYLDGLTISQIVERDGPIPVGRTVHLLRQACAGLSEAHGKGLVHRDIKPENLMVCRHGGIFDFVKILDYGLVKHVSQQHSRDLTRNLRILGTPLYMAPERLRNPADVDHRADIYAIGAVGFLMLTGKPIFESADDLELSTKVLNEEVPRPSTVAPQPVPVELDLLVQACLEKRREDRPQRVSDLVEAFDALALEHRWTQRDAELWWASLPNKQQ
ncbi:MAG: serine/threonine protein kinase [Burkholderiales bacterium]|nr:serine/threonine protein kinase [Burkholderiales bacterium]